MNNEYDSNTPTRKHFLDLTVVEWILVLLRVFCAQTVLGICVGLPVALIYTMAQEGQSENGPYIYLTVFAVAMVAGIVWLFTSDSAK